MTPIKTECKAGGCHLWQEHDRGCLSSSLRSASEVPNFKACCCFSNSPREKETSTRRPHWASLKLPAQTPCEQMGALSPPRCARSWGLLAGRWGALMAQPAEGKGKTSKASFQSWWAHCQALPCLGWARLGPAWAAQGSACSPGSSFGKEHCDSWLWMQTWMDYGETEAGMLQCKGFCGQEPGKTTAQRFMEGLLAGVMLAGVNTKKEWGYWWPSLKTSLEFNKPRNEHLKAWLAEQGWLSRGFVGIWASSWSPLHTVEGDPGSACVTVTAAESQG